MGKEIKERADFYKTILIILAFFVFVGSLFLFVNDFNFLVLAIVAVSDFTFTLTMFLICDILKTLEEIREQKQ